jgi:hypothetical protein
MTFKSKLTGTLVSAAVVAAMAAPAAPAMPLGSGPNQRLADVAPPPSSIAQSAGKEYRDLRGELGTSSLAGTTSPRPAIEPAPASGGFDGLSAAIGGLVAAALALASWTALGTRRTARA